MSDGTFLFTEHRMEVTELFRKPPAATLRQGTQTLLVRPGGELVIEGERIQATSHVFPPLVVGDSYLVFAQYLTSTGATVSIRPEDTFSVASLRVRGLTDIAAANSDLSRHGRGVGTEQVLKILRSAKCGPVGANDM